MENNSSSKYFWIILVLLILAGIVYSIKFIKPNEAPYQVLTPTNYSPGTKISLYKNAPPDFPKELILENQTLNYSGTVATQDGHSKTSVSYKSDKTVYQVLALYEDGLPKVGWQVSINSAKPDLAVLTAFKGSEKVLITISNVQPKGAAKSLGVMITFQYEK